MKTSLICLGALAAGLWSTPAAIIAQWDFNSALPDGDPGTGVLTPAYGSGSVLLLGGATAGFASGSTNDPATAADNSGWNTASYPAQGTSNKTAGVQFNVSTAGFSDIVVRWDHRVSGSASRYCRLQYTADGINFVDFYNPIASSKVSYFEPETIDLAALTELNDNPNFAFRVVSEFESTATGSGLDNFVPTFSTNNYARNGTIRFDMVTVAGNLLPGANTPPSISTVSNQTLRVNCATAPLSFVVADAEDPPARLLLGKTSSAPAIIPEANVVFSGSGSTRTVTITAANQPGVSELTISVTDTGGKSASASFTVTVLPANTAPFISLLPPANTLLNTATLPLAFIVSDAESPASTLSVAGSSANPALLPNTPANIVFAGCGSNRTVSLSPAAGQTGVAPITLTVSDGTNSTSTVFPLQVVPSAAVILYDPFAYPDGSLVTNSAALWVNRSGTLGQSQVTNGQLQVTSSQSEDVMAALIGGPYTRSNHIVLYAGFKATFLSLPKPNPGYFAHFVGGASLRGRIYAGTTNAAPGFFRLFVANGSDTTAMLAWNLRTNATYILVTRYDVDTATTTLWLDPEAESDAGVSATDLQSAVSISSYGFRQDSEVGATLLVDDLRVGLSFASVLSNPAANPVSLSLQRGVNNVVLRWTNSAFGLEAAPAVRGPFTNIPGATSPFTNTISGTGKFFRLRSN